MKIITAFGGCAALAIYLALFGAGLFMSSQPYREQLRGNASGSTSAAVVPAAVEVASGEGEVLPAVGAAPAGTSTAEAFVAAFFLYTPTNVAVLTLLAGFLGGCASKLTFSHGNQGAAKGDDKAKELATASELFRSESPFASMFRSLLVYLAFITGTFIATEAPFESPTSEQYVRLATTISLFAFVVGYDPTKFQQFLNLLPRRGGKV